MSSDSNAFIYATGPPDSMAWTSNYKLPKSLGKHEMLVKVLSASLNPIDYKLPHMWPVYMMRRGGPVGFDLCGVVESVGGDVKGFSVGDKVFGFGQGLANHTVVASSNVVKVPEGVSDDVAASAPVTAVMAYQLLRDAHAFTGIEPKHVVIIGASGGVGSCAVQIARAKCPPMSRIYGVCSGGNSAFVKSLGADEILDYTTPDFLLSRALPAKSVDVVVDCVSNPEDHNYVHEGMPLLKPKTGKYVACISASNWDWIKVTIGMTTGINMFRGQYRLQVLKQNAEDLKAVGDMLKSGDLKMQIEEKFKFEEPALRAAIEKLKHKRTKGKVVVGMV